MKTITQLSLILCLFLLYPFSGKSNPIPGPLKVAYTIASGNWSNPAIWSDGRVPFDSTFVIIKAGHTVNLTANSSCESLVIESTATLNNGAFELLLQLSQWAYGVSHPGEDDGVPYGPTISPYAPIDATWSITNPNNANWCIYKVDGIHAGTGNIIFSFWDYIDPLKNEYGVTISGSGTITNTGSFFKRNVEVSIGNFMFNSACNLTCYSNLNLFLDPAYDPIGAGGPGMAAFNFGTINLKGTANMVLSASSGTFENKPGASITLENGSLYLTSLTASAAGTTNSGLIHLQNGNLYMPSSSYVQNSVGGSFIINGSVLGTDANSWFLQTANSILSVTGEIFPAANPGELMNAGEPNSVIYNGTSPQNVIIPLDGGFGAAYSNLVINNSAGVTLNSDISVNGDLTLTNGLVNLGSSNLILSGTSTILGTPSATSMVVATGTGELRKTFTGIGSFTFPVGDNDGTAEYSPVTLDFTAGSFAGEYVGVNLQNSAYPGVTGSYLNRNWTVTTTPGLTGFTCDAAFNYVAPADVTGAESAIYCSRVAPTADFYAAADTTSHQLTALGLTSFGTFTGKEATTAWTGTIGSDWFTAGNWSDGIPGTITQVTIPGGLTNYPTLLSGTTIAGITINNGGSFIGSEFLTTGFALVKRDIGNTNFHLISSPVTSITSGSVFPLNQTEVWVREYNETTGDWNNLTTAGLLSAGKGYSVQMNQPQTAMFAGVLNSLPVTSTLAKLNPGVDIDRIGWNLLGNPFTSAIDWDMTDHTAIDGSVYVWNGTNFVSWNGAVGALTGGIIPAENAFFTKTAVNGATFTIPLTARVHSGIGFYKSSVANLLELTAEGNSFTDKTFIHFNDQASSGFDNQYDAYKLFGNENAPQLYSMITGDILSINELPMVGNEVVNLGFKCNTTGTYSISASGIENFSSNVPVFLQDLKLNVSQDMKANPVYLFSYEAGENENRFRLNFADVTGLSEVVNTGIRVFSFNKTVVIENTNLLKGNISIFDITGRKLFSQKLTGQARTNLPLQVVSGTYIVKVISANGTVNTKVHIQ